jgi:hypothetical protein
MLFMIYSMLILLIFCVFFFQITFVIRLHVRTREHVLKSVDHSDVFVVSVTMEITVNVCCLFSACTSLIHKKNYYLGKRIISGVNKCMWHSLLWGSAYAESLYLTKACFMRRILVASNAIKTIDNEMINLIKLHYLLFELHSTRPKLVNFILVLLPRR